MIVDTETDENGNDTQKEEIIDDNWGTRYTHVPANQIIKVDLRLK